MADVHTGGGEGSEGVEQRVVESLPSTGRVFLKLFLHSVAMFILPFWVYFTSRDYAQREYGVEPPGSYICGAVAAVVTIQAVIFSYIYQAYKEEQLSKKLEAAAKRD